jgi:hypothetical protein
MNELLAAIKDDLLDRRLRAVALLLVVALIAAIAYAVAGGGGTAPATPSPGLPAASSPAPSGSITPIAARPNPNNALAETPSGAAKQRRGALRNPFTPLPGAKESTAAISKSAAGSSGASSSSGTSEAVKAKRHLTECFILAITGTKCSSGNGSSGSGAPAKHEPTYEVNVAMGQIPPGTAPGSGQLKAYEHLKFQQKLPSPSLRLLAFAGVASDGKKAMFKLVRELLPRGVATCSPSPNQCQTIELEAGQNEQLEYLPPTGPAQVYELQVVSVTAH